VAILISELVGVGFAPKGARDGLADAVGAPNTGPWRYPTRGTRCCRTPPIRGCVSQTEKTHEATSLSNDALTTLLARVESEARAVSKQRRLLHERIDNMKLRSGDTPEFAAELLASLQREEREISDRRLQLHQHIAELRIERSRRLAPRPSHLSPVD